MAKHMKFIIASLVAFALVLTSCSNGDPVSELAQGAASATPTDGDPVGTPPPPVYPEPSPQDVIAASDQNRNSKASPLGRLCWVTKEAGDLVADLLATVLGDESSDSPARSEETVRSTKSRTASFRQELGSDEGLPSAVRPFWNRMLAAIQQAQGIAAGLEDRADKGKRRQAVDGLAQAFDVEDFPGARDFAEEAKRQPSVCPDI